MGNRHSLTTIYGYAFIMAFCSLVYELLIAQTFATFMANTVICYSMTVGLYLGAMGAGAFFWNKIFKDLPVSKTLFYIEIWMSLLGALSVMAVYTAHMFFGYLWLRYYYTTATVIFCSTVFLLIIVIGFFTGMEMPVLFVLGQNKSKDTGAVRRILGADYFGCLAAGLAFPLLLLPYLGLLRTAFLTALLNCLTAGHIFLRQEKPGTVKRKHFFLAAAMALMIISGFLGHKGLEQYFLKKYYYYKFAARNLFKLFGPVKNLPDIERKRSLYHNIDLVKIKAYGDPFTEVLIPAYSRKRYRAQDRKVKRHVLYLNGDFQFWTDFEEIYHEYFAHVPVILNKEVPGKILVLGGGDGILVRELLKYRQVQKIDLVDIDNEMISLAKTHPVIAAVNRRAFEDPRVTVRIGDAYQFVRGCEEKYDGVYVDFPDPKDYDVSKLYSVEFYHGVSEILAEGGFAVMDAPGLGPYPEDQKAFSDSRQQKLWRILDATLRSAGFKTIVPYVSHLELNNDRAREALKERLKGVIQLSVLESDRNGHKEMSRLYDKDKMVAKIIEGYVSDQRKAFVFMKKQNRVLDRSYRDLGLKYYVLNKDRFERSFTTPYKNYEIDTEEVNSIMRPTLPERSTRWQIRVPN